MPLSEVKVYFCSFLSREEISRYKELDPTDRLLILKALCEVRADVMHPAFSSLMYFFFQICLWLFCMFSNQWFSICFCCLHTNGFLFPFPFTIYFYFQFTTTFSLPFPFWLRRFSKICWMQFHNSSFLLTATRCTLLYKWCFKTRKSNALFSQR